MLQIASGKLFTRPIERSNALTGVLYSNGRLMTGGFGPDIVETEIGTFTGAGQSSDIHNLSVAFCEHMEETERGPGKGIVLSRTVDSYSRDIAVVASFATGVTIWSDRDVVRRLIESGPGAPSRFVHRVFDTNTNILTADADALKVFARDLIGLERKTFLTVMRALTLLNTGLHRLAEDAALSYALMVAAIETLATDHMAEMPQWDRLDSRKRSLFDAALKTAEADTRKVFRKAVLAAEHAGAGHRFRSFAATHLEEGFFRRPKVGSSHQIARYELDAALRAAYGLRSKYVHEARPLPDAIAHPHHHFEIAWVERVPVLTHQGLYNVARSVIRQFVATAPTVERESYDYTFEQSNVVRGEMGAQYWVGTPLGSARQGRKRIEGILSQIEVLVRNGDKPILTDIRPIADQVLSFAEQSKGRTRQDLLTFLALFNAVVHTSERLGGWDASDETHGTAIRKLSETSVAVTPIFGVPEEWSLKDHRKCLKSYFRQRVKPNGLKAPRLFEAAMCIVLAERYRQAGMLKDARSLLEQSADTDVGNSDLVSRLDGLDLVAPLKWESLLLEDREPESDTSLN